MFSPQTSAAVAAMAAVVSAAAAVYASLPTSKETPPPPTLVGLDYGPKTRDGRYSSIIKKIKFTIHNPSDLPETLVHFSIDWIGYENYEKNNQKKVTFNTELSIEEPIVIKPSETVEIEKNIPNQVSFSPDLEAYIRKDALFGTLIDKNVFVGNCWLNLYYFDAGHPYLNKHFKYPVDCRHIESVIKTYFQTRD